MRVIVLFVIGAALLSMPTLAQTETPTPTPTSTATPAPYIEFTLSPPDGTPPGQMARLEFTATAGETHIANLVTALLFSLWGMFLYWAIFPRKERK